GSAIPVFADEHPCADEQGNERDKPDKRDVEAAGDLGRGGSCHDTRGGGFWLDAEGVGHSARGSNARVARMVSTTAAAKATMPARGMTRAGAPKRTTPQSIATRNTSSIDQRPMISSV